MRELNLEEVKKIQLEILHKVVEFCEKNKITYFLCAGTMLGAIRHKGYIPWDDDIDLMMPRPDYEKFKKIFNDSDLILNDYQKTKSKNTTPFLKVEKRNTLLIEEFAPKVKLRINIDVFPIDGFPDDEDELGKHLIELKQKIRKIVLRNLKYSWQKHSVWWKSILLSVNWKLRKSRINLSYSARKVCTDLNILAQKYEFGKSGKAGIAVWGYGPKEVCPYKVYTETVKVQFEDGYFNALKDYDTYLNCVYGDYMKLPSEDKRKSHHSFKAYLVDFI